MVERRLIQLFSVVGAIGFLAVFDLAFAACPMTQAQNVTCPLSLKLCNQCPAGTACNQCSEDQALKDFFERIYHPCLDHTAGLPYALVVKGDTDVDGAVTSVERITAGLRWRALAPPVVVVGSIGDADREAAWELGATVAASLDAGII